MHQSVLILALGCLAFAGTTLAAPDLLPNFAQGTAFPAGLPRYVPTLKVPPYVEPSLPENAYRGVYVSSTEIQRSLQTSSSSAPFAVISSAFYLLILSICSVTAAAAATGPQTETTAAAASTTTNVLWLVKQKHHNQTSLACGLLRAVNQLSCVSDVISATADWCRVTLLVPPPSWCVPALHLSLLMP
jgi:hypothetical protein